ncbi:hypothetical protein [Luteimonas mephitis]|uniref:hypothetical protein n=1 Tax=Luteimonas mephitis TaxID=83615 RepID=UPI003A92534D
MSTSFKPLGLAVALALAGCSQAAPSADTADLAPPADTATEAPTTVADAAPAAEAAAVPAPQLQAAMRDLWHGHIVHARDYVIAVHAGNDADAKAAADAVVDNARQISGAVAGFYGQAGGDQMLTLLGGHWGAVKALTDARAAKDDAGATKAIDDLNANAAAIAKFLAGANPNLPEDTVHGLMLAHGAHHAQQINLILADDTAGEAQEWAAMQAHMDMIADALAAAIAKQFPDKAS